MVRTYVGRVDLDDTPAFTFPVDAASAVLVLVTRNATTIGSATVTGAGTTWNPQVRDKNASNTEGLIIMHCSAPSTGSQTLTVGNLGGSGYVDSAHLFTFDADTTVESSDVNNGSDATVADLSWTKLAAEHVVAAACNALGVSLTISESPSGTEHYNGTPDASVTAVWSYVSTATSGDIGWNPSFGSQAYLVLAEVVVATGGVGPLAGGSGLAGGNGLAGGHGVLT